MSNEHTWVVVGYEHEGLVVEGEPLHAQLEGRGLVMLPVDGEALRAGGPVGATAYQRRSYRDPVCFDGDVPSRACPLPLFLPRGVARVAWAAGLAFVPGSRGQLHLAADVVPGGPSAEVRDTDRRVRNDGALYVGSASAIVCAVPNAWVVLCLTGACTGVRVAWFALTVLPP